MDELKVLLNEITSRKSEQIGVKKFSALRYKEIRKPIFFRLFWGTKGDWNHPHLTYNGWMNKTTLRQPNQEYFVLIHLATF